MGYTSKGSESILVISNLPDVAYALETGFDHDLPVHVERRSSDTDGAGVGVVVIALPHPLLELAEVRLHPALQEVPAVIFAPGEELDPAAWTGPRTYLVTSRTNPVEELFGHILRIVGSLANGSSRLDA